MTRPERPARFAARCLMAAAAIVAISSCGARNAPTPMGFVPAVVEPGGVVAPADVPAAGAPPTAPDVALPRAPAVPGAPPSPQPAASRPRSQPAAAAPPGTPAPPPGLNRLCPVGAPVGKVTFFRATRQLGLGGDLTIWLVTARGTVTNKASEAIQIPVVDVKVSGNLTVDLMSASLQDATLEPGDTGKWETTSITQSAEEPTPNLLLAGKWTWMDALLKDRCPSG